MDRYGLICRSFYENPDVTQRELASILNLSLGTVNKLLGDCLEEAFLMTDMDTGKYLLTEQGLKYLEQFKVDGAVITAAGFGSRFVPLTFETPKGLLEVFGERMIERQIKQLHEAGITDITIIVGYLKEKFEYLIDKYQVKLSITRSTPPKIIWLRSTMPASCSAVAICICLSRTTGFEIICTISMSAARGTLPFTWMVKRQSGVFLLIKRDVSHRCRSVGMIPGSCMDLRSSRVIFPTS